MATTKRTKRSTAKKPTKQRFKLAAKYCARVDRLKQALRDTLKEGSRCVYEQGQWAARIEPGTVGYEAANVCRTACCLAGGAVSLMAAFRGFNFVGWGDATVKLGTRNLNISATAADYLGVSDVETQSRLFTGEPSEYYYADYEDKAATIAWPTLRDGCEFHNLSKREQVREACKVLDYYKRHGTLAVAK